MKVICVDNYDRDWAPDTLVEDSLSRDAAIELRRKLNASPDRPHDAWYVVVANDHILYEGDY